MVDINIRRIIDVCYAEAMENLFHCDTDCSASAVLIVVVSWSVRWYPEHKEGLEGKAKTPNYCQVQPVDSLLWHSTFFV